MIQRERLKCRDEPRSDFALNFDLRRYVQAQLAEMSLAQLDTLARVVRELQGQQPAPPAAVDAGTETRRADTAPAAINACYGDPVWHSLHAAVPAPAAAQPPKLANEDSDDDSQLAGDNSDGSYDYVTDL